MGRIRIAAGWCAAAGTLATVSATSLESFKKQPLDLRDRTVADLKGDEVSEFAVAVDRPSTTQPTTRPGPLSQ